MIRNIIGSWAFAAFLVVVAVVTWRLLDASRAPPAPPAPPPLVVSAPVLPMPPQQQMPPVEHTCGSGSAVFQEPAEPAVPMLAIGTQPFADVTIDGKRYGSTPLYGGRRVPVTLGNHVVDLFDKEGNRHYLWHVVVDSADVDNKVVVKLQTAESRTFGAVRAVSLDPPRRALSLREDEAQTLFEAAVNHLRAKDNRGGCALLSRIDAGAAPDSRWGEKSRNLFSHRCE